MVASVEPLKARAKVMSIIRWCTPGMALASGYSFVSRI
jgi:hypothetical protein